MFSNQQLSLLGDDTGDAIGSHAEPFTRPEGDLFK